MTDDADPDRITTLKLPPPSNMSARVAQSIRIDSESCLALAAIARDDTSNSMALEQENYYRSVAGELRHAAEEMARRPPRRRPKRCKACDAWCVCLLAKERKSAMCTLGRLVSYTATYGKGISVEQRDRLLTLARAVWSENCSSVAKSSKRLRALEDAIKQLTVKENPND